MAIICAGGSIAPTVQAQWQSNSGPGGATVGAVVGGDIERYVRALSISGLAAPRPWGSRQVTRSELRAMLDSGHNVAPHPWRALLEQATSGRATLGGSVFLSLNSGFAWGANDGALWQGRGLNAAAGASAAIQFGPLTAIASPTLIVAQNAEFPVLVASGRTRFADPLFPTVVDLPQRMGTRPYSIVSPGESSISLDLGPVSTGLSTASVGWGTGEAFPSILGPNAGGFAHAFVGTRSGGARIPGVGTLTGRYLFGVLEQTQWSPAQGSETYQSRSEPGTKRIGTGLTISFMPSVLPGLEIGASRFFHAPYLRDNRLSAWSKPFEGIFKRALPVSVPGSDGSVDAENQLAAFYARIVFPGRGVEANVEILREDHNWDARDLAQEPENNSAVLASIRAITHRSATRLATLTLEYFDGDVRPIGQVRSQGSLYVHSPMVQGHTQRGQLLGAPIGVGAIAGQRIAWERFTPDGSLRVNLQRWRNRTVRASYFEALYPFVNYPVANSHDWLLDGSVEASRRRGRSYSTLELGAVWAGAWQFGDSRTNLYIRASSTIF